MKSKEYLKQIQEIKPVKVAWSPNTESNIAGYKIHYGTSPGKYNQTIDVGNPINKENTQCETTLDLTSGTKYFISISAYDINNKESTYSKEIVEEVDPIIVYGAFAATVLIIKELILFFIFVAQIAAQTKVDKKRSKELNDIIKKMGVKKIFSVHIVPQKEPNAFTPGGKHVYITSGLLKLLSERESMSVLLHEVYHAIDYHIIKRMATEFPLYYIAAPIAVAAATAAGIATGGLAIIAIMTGTIVFSITMAFLKIPLTLLLYRKHEYDADNYAVKAGYGKEIASSLSKLEKAYIKATQGHKCGAICKVIRRIEESMDEHPPIRKRVEQALKNVELMKAIAKAKISSITVVVKNFFGKGK